MARIIKNLPNDETQACEEKISLSTNYLPQEKHNLGERKPSFTCSESDFRLIVEDF